jgi:hypothetical protein
VIKHNGIVEKTNPLRNAVELLISRYPKRVLTKLTPHYQKLLSEFFPARGTRINRSEHTNIKTARSLARKKGESMKNKCKNDGTLVGDTWNAIPTARQYGPLTDGYCYDALELEKLMITDFMKGIWPRSPYTRTRFKMEELRALVNHLNKHALSGSPLLPSLVMAFEMGYIKFTGILRNGPEAQFEFKKRIYTYFGYLEDSVAKLMGIVE